MAGTILLTGASGYVGSRLLRVLEEGGCAVRCLARQPSRVGPSRATTAVVAGDCLDEASLVAAMDGIDQAYYLVHSMASGPGFAVLQSHRLRISGFIAWLAWAAVHIEFLAQSNLRAGVLLQWIWTAMTGQRGSQLIVPPRAPSPGAR